MEDLSNENVIHIKNGDFECLQFRKLLEYQDIIRHAYGIKPMNYKGNVDKVIDNYRKLCQSISVDYNNVIKPNQMHTNVVKSVVEIEEDIYYEGEKFRETDGLVTNINKVVLATTNADCILLMFFDPVKKVIANVHSGWKGTFKKIAVNAVEKMVKEYGCEPKDIICCMCPSIRKCHFEVGEDVKNMCENIFSYTNQIDEIIEYVGKKDGVDKWVIDTVLINKIMLKDMGLQSENIIDSGICSVCNCDKIHSFRVEKEGYGLNSAIISIM